MDKTWLINCPELHEDSKRHLPNEGFYPTLGIYAIFSFLQDNGISVPADHVLDGEILSFNKIKEKVRAIPPGSIVGFYITVANYNATKKMSREIKSKLEEHVFIIYGGPNASCLPLAILTNNRFVDAIAAGDGEEIVLKLTQNENKFFNYPGYFYRRKDDLIHIPPKKFCYLPINILPPPLKHIPSIDKYVLNYKRKTGDNNTIPAITYFHKTGCDNHCIFCSVPLLGKMGRDRSPEEAWHETLCLKKKHNVNHIYEVSDNILYTKSKDGNWFEKFAKLAGTYNKNRELSFRFYASTNRIDKKLLEKFVKCGGDTLAIGFESNDNTILENSKAFPTNAENNIRVFNLIKKYHIKLVAFFIFGLPFETQKSASKTAEFIKKVADYQNTTFMLTALIVPLPGTPLWNKYITQIPSLKEKYYMDKNGNLIEPSWSLNEISKDFINICPDVHINYELLKKIQYDIYKCRPEIFSSWEHEIF